MSATAEQVAPAAQAPNKSTTIAALKPALAPEAQLPEVTVGFTSLQAFALVQRVANMFASSSIVPQRFQNNVANCAIALEMAQRLGASPLMVMQNLYVVHGTPGWAAKFLIACFNQCGRFTSIRYAFQGTPGKDDWGCRAWAIEKETGERLEGPLITIQLAKDEGWYKRDGSKWKTIPEQMLRYRSGAWFINTVAPEISMGLKTEDEIGDIYEAERGADGGYRVTLQDVRQAETPPAAEPEVEVIELPKGLQLIAGSKTIGALEATKSTLIQNCQDTNRDFPREWDAAINGRLESINQLL